MANTQIMIHLSSKQRPDVNSTYYFDTSAIFSNFLFYLLELTVLETGGDKAEIVQLRPKRDKSQNFRFS